MPTYFKNCSKCGRELLFAEEPKEVVICGQCGGKNNYQYEQFVNTKIGKIAIENRIEAEIIKRLKKENDDLREQLKK